MGKEEKLSKDAQKARRIANQKKAKEEEASEHTDKFKKQMKQSRVGTPKRARAKKKVGFWGGVERRARKAHTQWDKIADRKKRKKQKFLQKQKSTNLTQSGFVTPARAWNPYRRQVCGWMVEWLDKSRANGWSGTVVSGVRTPAYSEQLCYNMCGRPSCPGMCAGRASNHNATTGAYPQGAIDVSDYYNFANVQRRIGSPLKNNLPSDRVHFSVSGR